MENAKASCRFPFYSTAFLRRLQKMIGTSRGRPTDLEIKIEQTIGRIPPEQPISPVESPATVSAMEQRSQRGVRAALCPSEVLHAL
jgi:hypothetical protein